MGSTSQQQAYQQTIVNDINNHIDPSSLAQQFHTNVITYIPVAALPQNTNPPPGMPGAVDHWQGPDNSLWVAAAEMSSSRQGGTKYVPAATADPYAGAAAVARISENDQTAIAGSAGISIPGTGLGVNGGLSYSTANGYSLLDFKDLNGDGFPDVVANGLSVQYSPMTGGLRPRRAPSMCRAIPRTAARRPTPTGWAAITPFRARTRLAASASAAAAAGAAPRPATPASR